MFFCITYSAIHSFYCAFYFSYLLNSSFDGIIFLFSSSLLRFSHFCVLYPNSIKIFITNALNSLSDKLFVSVSLFIHFSRGFLLLFQVRTVSKSFHFLLTFCFYAFTVVTIYFKGCYYKKCPQLDYCPAFSGVRFDMDVSHNFPQGLLAALTL